MKINNTNSEIRFTLNYDSEFYESYDSSSFFVDNLKRFINSFESRYKTQVFGIALIGSAGTWRGRSPAGRVVRSAQGVLRGLGDVDSIDVILNASTNTVTLIGNHHDSYHEMTLYLISESKAKKFGLYHVDLIPRDDLVSLSKNLTKINLLKYYS